MPIVISWNGLVTIYNKYYCKDIELDNYTFSYLQKNVMYETLKIIMNNFNKTSEYLGIKEKKMGMMKC